ncbi:MAG: hypothetical protein JW984_07615 [Deltaproteobacteria bacterium]|uniref:Uncharacterized protein n=1 Tax=Candidatus Zymogenus saltonus TaxID=2844893 RepID=A0A9D8KFG1_9DELT|nr:hypothetical protein [Candidatus Zymogenus saltonus]
MAQKTGKSKGEEKTFVHDFFDTSGMADFTFKNVGKPPAGYPKGSPDTFSGSPVYPTYKRRRKALVDHCLKNPAGGNIKGYYYELVRLAENKGPVHTGLISSALRYIDDRYDCSDFVMLGIVRLLYQLKDSKLLPEKILKDAERTLLNFKYYPDEPGIDSMCYWTENHYIMFAANEYLAGQMFKDSVFTNSKMTGFEKMVKARERIVKWLDLRFKTGFSEWLSHIYYDEDITALANLIDFCKDPVIVRGAEMVLDLLFLDIALNSHKGAFGSSHGRSYGEEKRNAGIESTTDTSKLMFGTGRFSGSDNMSAVSLALGDNYRLPVAIYEIANSKPDEIINRQRMGIKIEEAKRWGLNFKDFASGMHFLTLEAYNHPKTAMLIMRMFDAYNWWENQFFKPFKDFKPFINLMRITRLLPLLAFVTRKDLSRNTREEVNLYTYRTPDYMLSCAQDYRKGYGGDQQHIWQATLSDKAICFTTHPGHGEDTSGGYWVGSGTLPRVAQIRNVLIASYNPSRMPGLYMTNKLFFTHAWFPKDEFDETAEKSGWIFGKKGDGYIALYSQNGYRWQDEGEDKDKEVICDFRKNIWVVEMGRKGVDGAFSDFIDKVSEAKIGFKGTSVRYESPSIGTVRFGWRGSLRHNGKRVSLNDYPRYDNRYVRADFPPKRIETKAGNQTLSLDLTRGVREVSEFVE